jgi:hypothetical protein
MAKSAKANGPKTTAVPANDGAPAQSSGNGAISSQGACQSAAAVSRQRAEAPGKTKRQWNQVDQQRLQSGRVARAFRVLLV